MTNRVPLLAGNWKMNHDHLQAIAVVQKLAWALSDAKVNTTVGDTNSAGATQVAVLVPFTDIRSVQTLVNGDKLPLSYGAQDLSEFAEGAYTGEISGNFLKQLECEFVVVGHSERREYHHEDDALVGRKVRAALNNDLAPILCVGESLEKREAGTHVEFTLGQLGGALADIAGDDLGSLVIAYEPVWAIGTGETATASDADEMARAIRQWLAATFDKNLAENTRILYGGSVKPDNVAEIMASADVDGALVGGASLDPDTFARLVAASVRG